MLQSEDRRLVRRCLEGDQTAFDALYDRHAARVFHLLCRLTGDEAEAEDLTQEAFLAAYRDLGSWRGESAFSTWLCGIAFHQCLRSVPNADQSTVEVNIASARAQQYQIQNDFDRAIAWAKRGLAMGKPFTDDAQFRRLGLGHLYREAGDRERAAAMFREVIAVRRQHPETWDLYRHQAEASLRLLARPRRSPSRDVK